MQSYSPIPAPQLPPPRPALQDVTARANQSPITLPPILNDGSQKSSMGAVYWEGEQARARDQAESLQQLYQQTAVDVGRNVPAPLNHRNPFTHLTPSSRGYVVTGSSLATTQRPTAEPTGPKSRKRKSETSSDDAIAAYKQNLDHITVPDLIDLDCSAVRSLIRKVLDRGIFKKGEFCIAIGSSNNAVNRFLAQRGLDGGSGSDVYDNAWTWFKRRELAGLRMPSIAAAQKKQKTTATGPSFADISNIHLDGEETDSVPVFDTCDVIRKKITTHLLKTPGLTQAQFCRDLYAQLKAPTCKSIQSKMLNDFRGKKGPTAGCTSSVYYAAYVYFEKLRIAEGKSKSNHRLEMEAIYPRRGMDRERDDTQGFWTVRDQVPVMDEYGRVTFMRH
ncbi:hypothetical protein N8I77_007101 [Diaporthe amygdali]|uniref:DUF7726 domain-containing protein n=1 Tax=Phomopsis amygdali TaxID=1214568 RepID=A0AAD9W340_PHOAM|nr:hypothetical protein N8I77_007101 [Diaporthe amygdali]